MAEPQSSSYATEHATPKDVAFEPSKAEERVGIEDGAVDDAATDREPLIRSKSRSSVAKNSSTFYTLRLSKLAVYCLLLEFLGELANTILIVPLISLFERAMCETYYREHTPAMLLQVNAIDEKLCKITPIQMELAKLRGWKSFFETLSGKGRTPAMISALAYASKP